MSESYFAQYVSPNIVIVPTVSFSTRTEKKAEPIITNICNHLLDCEQTKDTSELSPSGANCSTQRSNEVLNADDANLSTPIESTGSSKNLPFTKQDTISTEGPPIDMSQSIKELTSSKYKSRNNLVDLTGFNILKRDSISSLKKHEGSRQKDTSNIEQDVTKIIHTKENRKYSDGSDTSKNDESNKESPKSEKRIFNRCEENANSASQQNTTDMEVKMKKYFRHLWKRNYEKLKEKSSKDKRDRDMKSSKARHLCKDSKIEPSRSKSKLQSVSKNTATKSSKNAIINNSDIPKQNQDIDKYSSRSKSETKSSFSADSRTSVSHREGFLSPDSIKRYKDFQHFIHHINDDDGKNKTGKQNKTENLHNKKDLLNSSKTTINNSELKKMVVKHTQSVKSNLLNKVNTNQDNKERVNILKSVVQVNKNIPHKNSQRKCNERRDLRSRLSRKRTRSECFRNPQQLLENKLDRENLVITLKQDVKTDPKISTKLAPNLNKPKTKKCKKIKLVINIECPNSDSDDSDQNVNECCTSPQDLSFLDDFNIDEIVDSLNISHSQIENNKINTQEICHPIKKPNKNEKECINNGETKLKERLINNLNMKVSKIKKKETYNYEEQVIIINSDAEDGDLDYKIGSVTNTNKRKNEQRMKYNSENEKNIEQETSNGKELTRKTNEDNMQEEPMDLCGESDDSVQEIIDIIPENKHFKTSKHTSSTENVKQSDLLNRFDRPNAKGSEDLARAIKESFKTVNKKMKLGDNTKANKKTISSKSKTICSRKPEDSTRKSHIVKNTFERKVTKNLDSLTRSDNNAEKAEIYLQPPEDPIEVSLETMFNNVDQNADTKMDILQLNGSERHIKDETLYLQKSGDIIEASLETMFNDIKQEGDINMDIELSNASDQHIKKEVEILQTAQETIEVSRETMNNGNNPNAKINKIKMKPSKNADKHSKREADNKINIQQKTNNKMDPERRSRSIKNIKQKAQSLLKCKDTNKKSLEIPVSIIKKANIKKDTGAPTKADNNIKEKTENSSKKSLQIVKNTAEKKAEDRMEERPLSRSDKNIKQKPENVCISKDTIKKSLDAPNYNIEKKASIKIAIRPSQPSDKNVKEDEKRSLITENKSKKSLETVKNIVSQKIADQKDSRPPSSSNKHIKDKEHLQKSKGTINKTHTATINNAKKKSDIKVMKPLNMSDKNNIEKEEYIQKSKGASKDTIKKSLEPTINIADKKADSQIYMEPPITFDNIIIEKAEHIEKSADTDRKCQETQTKNSKEKFNIKTSIKPSNKPDNNINEKAEKHLQNSEGTTKKHVEAAVDNTDKITKINIDIEPSSISDENNREKAVNNLPKSEVISGKLLKTVYNNIQHKAITKNTELSTNSDKTAETITSIKKSVATTEKSLPTINTKTDSIAKESIKTAAQSHAEEKHVMPVEIVNNNIQKPGTMDDDVLKQKVFEINSIEKDSETNKRKRVEIKMETNTKINQKQIDTTEKMVLNGTENIDLKIQSDESKSNKLEVKWAPTLKPFIEKLEARMSDNFKKYTVTSLIHSGHFSSIYKCKENNGESYAVKVLNSAQRKRKGMCMERILSQLHKYRSRGSSCLLYLMDSFGVQGLWCLLSEYYPKNLKQALVENMRSFHIDLVQVLARQLVDAVNMLTNNNIIHSDIKPTHILLNSGNDRLKLCGFDRANYCDRMQIIPSTGSPCYRAPEIILGFLEDHRIDVWSTALVIFEMATYTKLFPGHYNNDILYKQLCTLGSFDWAMAENSRYRDLYFSGSSFIRHIGDKGQRSVLVHALHRNKRLRRQLFLSYNDHWAPCRTRWQVTNDMDKLETLHSLLEQMLVLDPRHRLPIQFVGASEFIHDTFV